MSFDVGYGYCEIVESSGFDSGLSVHFSNECLVPFIICPDAVVNVICVG